MYLWLLEMIQPQCRHEREIKAESDVPNPLLRGLENAELFSCFVSLSACVTFGVLLLFFLLGFFWCVHSCVYLVRAQSVPILNPSKFRVSTANTNINTNTNTLAYLPLCFWQGPSPFS